MLNYTEGNKLLASRVKFNGGATRKSGCPMKFTRTNIAPMRRGDYPLTFIYFSYVVLLIWGKYR
jgi:hypothetical protein